MVQESRSLQTDVLAPDDVLVLLDGSVNTVARSIRSPQELHTLNYRLFSLRPDELEDTSRAKVKIAAAISAIEAGSFDAMSTRAAAVQRNGEEVGPEPHELRDEALKQLQKLLGNDQTIRSVLEKGKVAVQQTRAKGILPIKDS